MVSKLETIANSVKGTIAGAGLVASIACGGGGSNPVTGPAPSPTPPTNGSISITATETFSGSPVVVDYVAECGSQRVTGKTDGTPTTVQSGNCTLKIGINGDNQVSNQAIVPSIYENVPVNGNFQKSVDLASYEKLYGGTSHAPIYINETYYGQNTNATLGKWTHRPSKFIIYNDPSVPNQIVKGNANFDRYLSAMRYLEEFTNGTISVPTPDEVEIINSLPEGVTDPATNAGNGRYQLDSFNYINANTAREGSVIGSNGIIISVAITNIQSTEALVAEILNASIHGNGESSEPSLRYLCILDSLLRRNHLDDNWIKGMVYGKRNNGDRIFPTTSNPSSQYGEFPHEIRR